MLSILVAVSSLTTTIEAQEEENATDSEEPIKFLAIQHAQSGSISEINATAYSLELNDVSDKTILFSDRPDRIIASVSTSDFIGNWSIGEDNFAMDSPNAVLVVDELEDQDVIIGELFNPIYEADKITLKYDFIPIGNQTSIDLSNFGQSTIIIDEFKQHKDNPT